MIILLILLNLCHSLADYTWLATPVMLQAKKFGTPWFPVLAHASVHGLLMWIVLVFYLPDNVFLLQFLVTFQVLTHFGIDMLKGRINQRFTLVQSPANVIHWVVFGFDQYLHQIVIIIIAYLATK